MSLRLLITLGLPLLQACSSGPDIASQWSTIEFSIATQRRAGHAGYDPQWFFLVGPSTSACTSSPSRPAKSTRRSAAAPAIGARLRQCPPSPTGFCTMGGVRIAKNGNHAIQTDDSKMGVRGIDAEMLYPPTQSVPWGQVTEN